MAFCRNCGNQVNDGTKFCPKCGKTLDKASLAPQQTDESQSQFADEPEGTIKVWQKILYLLFWPAGLLAGIIYTIQKKRSMARKAFVWGCASLGASIGLMLSMEGCSNNEPENTTKVLMVEKFKEQGISLIVKDLTLVHKSGNEYSGIAECTVDGEAAQFAIKVIYDGKNVQAEWELSDVGGDNTDDVEEYSDSDNVEDNSEFTDVEQAGYQDGYEFGFQYGSEDFSNTGSEASILYSQRFGAPSTPEERQLFQKYKDAYIKGYEEGLKAKK